MEDTHGVAKLLQIVSNLVLILIIMEDTHGAYKLAGLDEFCQSLNPYYNGRYSWSSLKSFYMKSKKVLILIIMEDTHGE